MKKLLFPVTYGIPEKHEGLVSYHICEDGIYRTKKVAGRGTITVKVDGIPGTGKGEQAINVLPRKIPMEYFWKIRDFFKYVEKNFGNRLEAYILIGYNYEKDDFCLHVPEHTVTAASVHYDIESFWTENPGYYLIMDIHSHSSGMSAFFSSVDNKDDNRERFSMVMGKINNIIPDVKVRFSSLGFYDFELDDLFTTDIVGNPILDMPAAIKKIKLYERAAVQSTGPQTSSGYYQMSKGPSLFETIRFKMQDKKFSLKELMGENW